MAHQKTAVAAAEMFADDKLYQVRARRALPLLVRQALAQEPIHYGQLAAEMGMANPRNMNFVLGSVGVTLNKLGRRWGEKIPPIQSLAIAKWSGVPGKGFFEGFTSLESPTRQQRGAALKEFLGQIFSYPKWLRVLQALDLPPASNDKAVEVVECARQLQRGGEGEAHRNLKDRIFQNPTLVGAPSAPTIKEREYGLPSGDRLDIYFEQDRMQFAVEVKASTSADEDIARGLFQCVKYEAILTKWRAWLNVQADVHVVLALGGLLPSSLIGLRNALHVTIIEQLEGR